MEIFQILTAVITVASVIAKITPNETDNEWIAHIQKVIDVFAMTTGKTELKNRLK